MQKRYEEIDALKGFAMFLVVLGHSIIVYPINLHENNFFNNLYEFISTFHLPLFFIISGYCFSYKDSYKQYITKKIKRILIPYLIFSLLNILLRTLAPSLVNKSDDFVTLLMNVIFNGGEYWFLYTLFMIFLFYPLLYKINRNKVIAIILEILLLIASLLNVKVNMFCITSLLKYLFYFNSGVLIKIYKKDIFENNKNNVLYTLVIFIILIFVFLLYRKYTFNYLETICAILGILFSYLLSGFEYFARTFKSFGNNSLQIHLCNGYSLVVSRTIICNITSNPFNIVLFNLFVSYIVVQFVIEYIVKRSKVLSFLMGIN